MTWMTELQEQERRRGWRRRFTGLRARIVASYIGLLAVVIVASEAVARQVLVGRVDERINRELVQEGTEVRRLAGGRDPVTGEPFEGRVRRIFDVYLSRNVPSRNEALLTFVDGEPYIRSRQVVPYRLDLDPDLVARWGMLETRDRGSVDTPAGRVEYLAVPLAFGGETRGVFVVAIFRDLETEELDDAITALVGVGIAVLVLGSILAWRLADSILRPVRVVTRTARAITATDLSRRLPVTGTDEIAQLAGTFNDLLGRLEEAFQTQRRFLDDAGHELRTPLTIVRGHLELLDDDPEERERTLALVLDELDRMGRMVNDLLVLAKAKQPDFLDLEPVDVESLTRELHAKATALDGREWKLERTGRGVIVADRQRLTQAVVQLAQNAVTHSGADAPVRLGSAVTDAEARFWVADEGPGIPVDERERIFQRFNRPDVAGRGEGAGLGLAIVRAIAEAHGGRVDVETAAGAGSTFSVVVPLEPPAEQARAAE
jgi:signal transduction histidine kinase